MLPNGTYVRKKAPDARKQVNAQEVLLNRRRAPTNGSKQPRSRTRP